MATVSVRVVTATSGLGGLQPVADAVPLSAEAITSSGTSAQGSTAIAPATWRPNLYWLITVSGGNVWVKFGTNPTAASGDDHLILDGQIDTYAVTEGSQKIAVIDA